MMASLSRLWLQKLLTATRERVAFGIAITAVAMLIASPSFAQIGKVAKVALVAADGQPLVGTFTKSGLDTTKGGVVLVPSIGGSRYSFELAVPKLVKSGFAVLAVDPRGHGDSMKTADGSPVILNSPQSWAGVTADVEAACEYLVKQGIPMSRLAVFGAGTGALVALSHASSHPDHPKALVLLSPPADDRGLGAVSIAKGLRKMAVFLTGATDEMERVVIPWRDALGHDLAITHPAVSAAGGTGIFGKAPTFETALLEWLESSLSVPDPIVVKACSTILLDGDVRPTEGANALILDIIGAAGSKATARVSHRDGRLEIGFDIPERYVRQNEVTIFLDANAVAPRLPDARSFRISFSPKNSARKPIVVSVGTPRGFEDVTEMGVVAYAHIEDPKRWTAEVSVDLKRFFPDGVAKGAQLGLGVSGQKTGDRHYYPDHPAVSQVPKTWAPFTLK